MRWLHAAALAAAFVGAAAAADYPGAVDQWNGYTRHTFTLESRQCFVVEPKLEAKGRPWIWRARFWGHRPEVDLALLDRGYHLVYMDIVELLGSPTAVGYWDAFYRFLTKEHDFSPRVALEGMSRGGLMIYAWARVNPEKVSAIYADAPVCDFRTWPLGGGGAPPAPNIAEALLRAYGFRSKDEALAWPHNPVDSLAPLAAHDIPLLHVHGTADDVVPLATNTAVVEERYRALGGRITVILKPGVKHVHGLADPAPIIDFIVRNTR